MSKLCFITEADRREFLKTAMAAAGAPGAGSLPSLGASTLQKFAGISPQLVDIIMRNALLNVTNNSDLLQRGATIHDGIFKGSEMFGWPATPKEEQALKNLKIDKNDIAQYMASNPESLKHFYLEAVNFQNFSDLKNTLAMADNLLGGLFSKYEQARGVAGVLRDLFEMYGKCGKSAEYPLTNGVAIKPALQKLTTRIPEISKIFGDSLNSPDMHGFIKKANEKGLLDRSTSTELQNIQRSDDEYKRKKAAISHKHRQQDREEQQKQAEKELQDKKDYEDQLSRWEGEGGSVLESKLKKALASKGLDQFSINEGLLGSLAATAGLALAGGPQEAPQARQVDAPAVQRQELRRPTPYINLKKAQDILDGAQDAIRNINTLEAAILPRLYKDGELKRNYYSAGKNIAGNVYQPIKLSYTKSYGEATAALQNLRQDLSVLASYTPQDLIKTFTFGGDGDQEYLRERQRQLDRTAQYLKGQVDSWSKSLDTNAKPVKLQFPPDQPDNRTEEEKRNDDFIATYYRWAGSVEELLPPPDQGSAIDGILTTLDLAVGDSRLRQEERRKTNQTIKEDINTDIKSLCQAYLDNNDFTNDGLLPIRAMVDLAYNSGEEVPDEIEMPSERTWSIIMTMTVGQRADYLRRLCDSFIKMGKFSLEDMCEQCDKQPVADAEIQLAMGEDTWTNWCYDCLKREADIQGIEWPTSQRDTWSGGIADNH